MSGTARVQAGAAKVAASRRKNGSGKKRAALEPTEHQLHCTVASYLDRVLLAREAFWTTFPSGGYALNRVAAAHLKQRGLKAGMPDLFIWYANVRSGEDFWPYRCLGIELKRARKYQSPSQLFVAKKLSEMGVPVVVCRCIEDVAKELQIYGVPTRESKNYEVTHNRDLPRIDLTG